MEQSPGEANSHSASQDILPFMELEVSLPCSQELAMVPYPESDKSSPHISTLLLFILFYSILFYSILFYSIHFNINFNVRLGFPSGFFVLGFANYDQHKHNSALLSWY
jgi:hypothetical protein